MRLPSLIRPLVVDRYPRMFEKLGERVCCSCEEFDMASGESLSDFVDQSRNIEHTTLSFKLQILEIRAVCVGTTCILDFV